MKKFFIVLFSFILISIFLIWLRFNYLPDEIVQMEIMTFPRRYYSFHEFETGNADRISKVYIYKGFFMFDKTITDNDEISRLKDGLTKVEDEDVVYSSFDIKLLAWDDQGKLAGIGGKKKGVWIITCQEGTFQLKDSFE